MAALALDLDFGLGSRFILATNSHMGQRSPWGSFIHSAITSFDALV